MTLPKASDEINADLMTDEQLYAKLQKGYDDMGAGRVQNGILLLPSPFHIILLEKHGADCSKVLQIAFHGYTVNI